MSSLFNTDNPAIAEAQQRVMDCLFTHPKVVTDIEQQKLKTAVRDQHKDMRRAAAELAAAQIDRTPLVALMADDAQEAA